LGWFYVCVLLVFLALNGKSYYTLGAYPVLTAAGAVYWERLLQKNWSQTVLVIAVALPGILLFPTGIPLWPAARLATYFEALTQAGIDTTRWEDGELHALPQDYADMLGWTELAALVDTAVAGVGHEHYIVFGENYGQAGAVSHLCSPEIRSRTVSFSDTYRLWAPEHLPAGTNTLVYINDELGEDVQALFADITQVGSISDPLARERGTTVWICRQPHSDMDVFWSETVGKIRRHFGIPPH
jgi:hypothetical protein